MEDEIRRAGIFGVLTNPVDWRAWIVVVASGRVRPLRWLHEPIGLREGTAAEKA